jgi:hypothetical protein
MPYTLTFDLHYGAAATGLTLAAVFRNTDGTTNGAGSAVFTERGGGDYEGSLTVPDGFQGWVRFSSNGGATPRGTLAINPQETENTDVKVSTRNALAPPALSAIIAGVLDELLSAHTQPGSVAAGISDATGGGASADPWLTLLPGAYTLGQAGYTIGHNLDVPTGILARAGATITTTGPVSAGGDLALIRGDTYQVERGTALQWTSDSPVDWGATPAPVWTFVLLASGRPVLAALAVISGTPGAWIFRVELTAAQTQRLAAGVEYRYSIRATWADADRDRVTLLSGRCTVS